MNRAPESTTPLKDDLFVHLPLDQYEIFRDLLARLRQQPELYISAAMLDGEAPIPAVETVAAELRVRGAACTIHAPYQDLAPGTPDRLIRSITIQRFRQTIEIAAVLPTRVVVGHAGFDHRRHSGSRREWLAAAGDTWREIAAFAADKGITLVLENVYEQEPSPLIELLEALQPLPVRACLDVGHALCFSRTDLDVWLQALDPLLGHIHLHDNDGSWDDHLGLGQGRVRLDQLLDHLAGSTSTPTLTIEGHGLEAVLCSLRYLQHHGIIRHPAAATLFDMGED